MANALKCHRKPFYVNIWHAWEQEMTWLKDQNGLQISLKCISKDISNIFNKIATVPGVGLLISLILSFLIQILTQGKNPGIAWKYTLPKVMNVTQPATKRFHHTWHTEQSDCSVSCGGGKWVPNSASQLISAYRFYPVYRWALCTLGNPNAV